MGHGALPLVRFATHLVFGDCCSGIDGRRDPKTMGSNRWQCVGDANGRWRHCLRAVPTLRGCQIGILQLDLWPDMFEVRANCADAATNLLGVPYEFWSLALFAMVAAAALWVIRSDA